MLMPEFISEKIEVKCEEKSKNPISFIWRKREYKIKEVILSWSDFGFPPGSPKRKTWNLRRHRNCFRVETESGEKFEIYCDRGTTGKIKNWVLFSKLE
jgi:hypothetical protein